MNRQKIRSFLLPVISIGIFLILWHYLGLMGFLVGTDIPSTTEIADAAAKLNQQGKIWESIWASVKRVFPGLFFGSILGVFIGIPMGRLRILYQTVGPILNILRAFPAVAMVPLLIKIFEMNEFSRVLIVTIGVFFPVWVAAYEGAIHVPRSYLDVADNLGLSKLDKYIKIIIFSSLPFIIAGIRTAIAMSYIMVFIAEFIGANEGIGYQISVAHTVGSTDFMLLGLIILGSLSYITDTFYSLAMKHLFPWMEYTNV